VPTGAARRFGALRAVLGSERSLWEIGIAMPERLDTDSLVRLAPVATRCLKTAVDADKRRSRDVIVVLSVFIGVHLWLRRTCISKITSRRNVSAEPGGMATQHL
jgi:hypothetical protein